MTITSKPCYAIGCDTRIERHKLMCPRHWAMVPHTLQDQVYTTFQKFGLYGGATAYLLATFRAQLTVAAAEHIENAETERTRAKLKKFEKGKAR
jgi:hypothetical protein